jgi:hypothetical protein
MAATIKDSYPGFYSITSSIEEGNLGPAYDRCGSNKLGHSPYVGSMSGFAESGHGSAIMRTRPSDSCEEGR